MDGNPELHDTHLHALMVLCTSLCPHALQSLLFEYLREEAGFQERLSQVASTCVSKKVVRERHPADRRHQGKYALASENRDRGP
eukprot:1136151-Pelagomonas_calceolata.AAC.5